eukprot:9504048-Pyramimonas_sp.AAC.2
MMNRTAPNIHSVQVPASSASRTALSVGYTSQIELNELVTDSGRGENAKVREQECQTSNGPGTSWTGS